MKTLSVIHLKEKYVDESTIWRRYKVRLCDASDVAVVVAVTVFIAAHT